MVGGKDIKSKDIQGIELVFDPDRKGQKVDPKELERLLTRFTPPQRRALLRILDEANRKEAWSNEAIEEFLRGDGSLAHAMGISQDEIEAYVALGEKLLDMGKLQDARRTYEFLAQVYPIDPRSYLALGAIELEQSNNEKAETLFTTAIERHGGDLGAHAGRVIARMNLGKDDLLEEDIEKALEYDPEGEIGLTAIMAQLLLKEQ